MGVSGLSISNSFSILVCLSAFSFHFLSFFSLSNPLPCDLLQSGLSLVILLLLLPSQHYH
jgi:hypothetical protein